LGGGAARLPSREFARMFTRSIVATGGLSRFVCRAREKVIQERRSLGGVNSKGRNRKVKGNFYKGEKKPQPKGVPGEKPRREPTRKGGGQGQKSVFAISYLPSASRKRSKSGVAPKKKPKPRGSCKPLLQKNFKKEA